MASHQSIDHPLSLYAASKKVEMNFLPLQLGDVPDTYANIDDLVAQFNYKPATRVEEDVTRFVDWYREYCRI